MTGHAWLDLAVICVGTALVVLAVLLDRIAGTPTQAAWRWRSAWPVWCCCGTAVPRWVKVIGQ